MKFIKRITPILLGILMISIIICDQNFGYYSTLRDFLRYIFFIVLFVRFFLLPFFENREAVWFYQLPNGYKIWHFDKKTTILEKEVSKLYTQEVVTKFIVSFCYNERFICTKAVQKSSFVYYVVDTIDDSRYGPFITEEEFLQKTGNLKMGKVCKWIETKPVPEGAVFSKG